jgi:alkyl hydroperoxide reductase subunit AhpC
MGEATIAMGQCMPPFQARWHASVVTNKDVAGRWLVVASLPRTDLRCRDMMVLIRASALIRRRQALLVVLVDNSEGDADLIGSMADCRDGHNGLMVLADPEGRVASGLGMKRADGRLLSATMVIDPDGIACGLIPHHAEAPPPVGRILARFDALRAGRAGCSSVRA